MQYFPHLLRLVTLTVTLAWMAVPQVEGKRFDCRLFCRETGFRGMLGGCRCSFTLFTAKRALRDPVEENDSLLRALSQLMPRNLANKKTFNPPPQDVYQPTNILANYITKASGKEPKNSGLTPKLPGYPSTSSSDYEDFARAATMMMVLQKQEELNDEEKNALGSSFVGSHKGLAVGVNSGDDGEIVEPLQLPY